MTSGSTTVPDLPCLELSSMSVLSTHVACCISRHTPSVCIASRIYTHASRIITHGRRSSAALQAGLAVARCPSKRKGGASSSAVLILLPSQFHVSAPRPAPFGPSPPLPMSDATTHPTYLLPTYGLPRSPSRVVTHHCSGTRPTSLMHLPMHPPLAQGSRPSGPRVGNIKKCIIIYFSSFNTMETSTREDHRLPDLSQVSVNLRGDPPLPFPFPSSIPHEQGPESTTTSLEVESRKVVGIHIHPTELLERGFSAFLHFQTF